MDLSWVEEECLESVPIWHQIGSLEGDLFPLSGRCVCAVHRLAKDCIGASANLSRALILRSSFLLFFRRMIVRGHDDVQPTFPLTAAARSSRRRKGAEARELSCSGRGLSSWKGGVVEADLLAQGCTNEGLFCCSFELPPCFFLCSFLSSFTSCCLRLGRVPYVFFL